MNDYKRVYMMSNENIGAFREIYDFDRASVLAVLGSGDQYFNSLLYGAEQVEVFDVNYTAWLLFRIKFKALKILKHEDFIALFLYRRIDDMDIFEKMYKELDYEELNYYVYLIKNGEYKNIINNAFTPNILVNNKISFIEKVNPYLEENNYYKLQEIIRRIQLPRFRKIDFMRMNVEEKYDILLLSNIYDFIVERSEEYINKIEEYKAKEVMGKYSFSIDDNNIEFVNKGFKIDRIEGVIGRDNYILSLKR